MRLNKSKVLFPTFSILFLFYSYIKAPLHRPQNPSTENPNPKNPIEDPNPKIPTPTPP